MTIRRFLSSATLTPLAVTVAVATITLIGWMAVSELASGTWVPADAPPSVNQGAR